MISGQKFSKTLTTPRLAAVAMLALLSACSTAPKLDYREADYRETIYQITYDLLRAAECRQSESRQAYRPCDHSYFRDYEQYRRMRSDFIDASRIVERPF